jgi:hypothetical protein
MIRHEPNRKHGADTYKGPYLLTEVNDNGTVQLRVPTHTVERVPDLEYPKYTPL